MQGKINRIAYYVQSDHMYVYSETIKFCGPPIQSSQSLEAQAHRNAIHTCTFHAIIFVISYMGAPQQATNDYRSSQCIANTELLSQFLSSLLARFAPGKNSEPIVINFPKCFGSNTVYAQQRKQLGRKHCIPHTVPLQS